MTANDKPEPEDPDRSEVLQSDGLIGTGNLNVELAEMAQQMEKRRREEEIADRMQRLELEIKKEKRTLLQDLLRPMP